MMSEPKMAVRDTDDRAQSELVGLLTIFGIVFLSISVILLVGLPLVDNATENAQIERFQNEFAVLDQEIRESVYAPGQSSATVNPSGGSVSIDDGTGSLSVTVTYDPENGGNGVSTGAIPLGSLEYDSRGDRGVVYEAGGVWARFRGEGLSMRTPPDISYSGNTLNFDMMSFDVESGAVGVGGDAESTLTFSSEGTHATDELREITERSLEAGELTVSVRSKFADGWAEYFNRTVASGTATVETAESSDERGYANVTFRTGPPLYGVEYLGQRYDDGSENNVTVYDSAIGDAGTFNTTVELDELDGIDTLPVDGDDISVCLRTDIDETLDSAEPVTAGAYELDGPLNDDYEFDTSDGVVEVHATVNNLNIEGDITVKGDNPVVFFAEDVTTPAGTEINLEDDRTELLQIFTMSDNTVAVNNYYNGTIYAPEAGAQININNEFHGAAIADDIMVTGGAEYYHDASLRRATLPTCIDQPLRNFNAVERRVAVR